MELTQAFEPAPAVKVMINIGATLDVCTGTFIEGRNGEYILNGGLAPLTGIVGIGNNFKSTIMNWMQFTGLARILGSKGSTYDTEVNVQEWHLREQYGRIPELQGEDILENGRWVVTDKTVYSGNVWYAKQKAFLESKIKNAKSLQVVTPFWNRDRTAPMTIAMPTFTTVDSFTEFETEDVMEMQDKNELGESGGNTIHMRQGLAKLRFLMEAPRLNAGSYNYLAMTAHIGKETTMQNAGPGGQVPVKKLETLKNGDKIKGTTDKFLFITHNCWQCYGTKPLTADDGNGPRYPRDTTDKVKYDTDLQIVTLRNLRSKSGISGMTQLLVVSQSEGVLPALTEFHYLREMGQFGFEGNNINYALNLYPECKLSRTTIRSKIDDDEKLRRALNITAEMLQIGQHMRQWSELLCTPKELYDDLKALGYDWDILLNTRGWWTIDNDKHPIPFLSTMDLLRMRAGLYIPYWFTAEQKAAIKPATAPAAVGV